jgi:hypothetical protein
MLAMNGPLEECNHLLMYFDSLLSLKHTWNSNRFLALFMKFPEEFTQIITIVIEQSHLKIPFSVIYNIRILIYLQYFLYSFDTFGSLGSFTFSVKIILGFFRQGYIMELRQVTNDVRSAIQERLPEIRQDMLRAVRSL